MKKQKKLGQLQASISGVECPTHGNLTFTQLQFGLLEVLSENAEGEGTFKATYSTMHKMFFFEWTKQVSLPSDLRVCRNYMDVTLEFGLSPNQDLLSQVALIIGQVKKMCEWSKTNELDLWTETNERLQRG